MNTLHLDLKNAEDRSIYRQRVAYEFSLMTLAGLREAAIEETGTSHKTRLENTNAIANARMNAAR